MSALVTGGMVIGSATAGNAAPQRPPPPKIDHQLCYKATAKGFKIPKGIVLKNQIDPKGFKPKVSAVALHCNPVQKTITGAVFKITNPLAHLLCFAITTTRQKQHLMLASNQFDVADLNVAQPNLLCLPSWKRLNGPPLQKQPQPPGLDHFTCYPVTVQQGGYHVPAGVTLKDEFARKPVRVKISDVPVELCVPTEKIVGKHITKVKNPTMSLLCFPVSQTPLKPKVFDKNQFGTAAIHIHRTALLCLPTQTVLIR